MRPKVSGRGCAGTALTCAPSPSASPALEPSAQPQARGTGQRAGSRAASGSQVLSEAGTGARPASEAGVKAGARRPSAFSAIQGDVRSVPNNSDAPWARLVFQGPFGSRATGLGTGKAVGIWKTPAAYFGRRPGVSGPERAAFIRELEEALCPNLHPPVKKITQEDVKVMLYLLQEVCTAFLIQLLPPVWEIPDTGRALPMERDLNTAARIGQSLVQQNSVLMEENSKPCWPMAPLSSCQILHLRHQVNLRDDLLQLYSDSDEKEEEEAEEDQQHAHPCDDFTEALLHQHHCPQLEALQEKLRLLEEENHQLREEASQLDTLEDEEQMLILQCVEQFCQEFQTSLYEMPTGDTSSLRYDFCNSEDGEQVQGFEAEEGLMLAADIMPGEDFTPAEKLVPEEELGTAEKVLAEEGVMKEAELVLEETEGWEEVEPELDEATRMNMVTSALEASGLGPSHLDMKYVLQQQANWQDAHYRRQLRRKIRTSCRSSCR
uniref:Huntingtin associated protein 1 n=1 Tax=Mandrillus leucophaeus TaxID=9568 RepID=A0A2K5XGS7_MANLE